MDRYFVELCLVFGCVSSVGLYDRGARVIIWIALRETGFPFWCCIQHLDDMVYLRVVVHCNKLESFVLYNWTINLLMFNSFWNFALVYSLVK